MAENTHRLGFADSNVRLLAGAGLIWLGGYAAFLSSWDVPLIPRLRPLADLAWGNWVVGALLLAGAAAMALWPRPAPSGHRGNRWAGPAMITCGVLGLLWIVTFYTLSSTTTTVPVLTQVLDYLGSWNLVVGMSLIMAAFGFAMKWE